MRTRFDRRLVMVALLAIVGCSSNGGGGGGGTGGTGGGGTGGTGGGGGTGGTGGGGGGGTGGTGGGGGGNGNTVVIQTQPFTVQPGGEVFMCQDFANPFGGADAEISQIDSNMTPGSHHMLLFFQDGATDSNVASCPALQFKPMLFGAQQPTTTLPYPAGVAALVKGTQGFHMQMHYLNASQAPLMAQVTITFTRATPGTITQHAGVFFFNNVSGINVAPGTTDNNVTASCTFPKAVNVMYATAHTHKFTDSFTASTGGNTIYTTTSWDNSPNQAYAPPLMLAQGAALSWKCVITNPSSATQNLTFGESANTNDMCIFDGQYYPADDANPTIQCMR
ncbi:MAG: hypothetical protein ACXVDD_10675 [Polyangia bacterium]